jgi:uncharacterized phage-associated protein
MSASVFRLDLTMSFPATSVANTFLDIAESDGATLTNMKLQKLIYFAQGWALGTRGYPIVNEQAEAWQYGPVYPSVYHAFSSCGANPIDRRATDIDFANFCIVPVPAVDNADARAFLASIWQSYGKLNATQLSQLSHVPNGPWDRARRESGGMRGTDIPVAYIKDYFANLAATPQVPAAPSA